MTTWFLCHHPGDKKARRFIEQRKMSPVSDYRRARLVFGGRDRPHGTMYECPHGYDDIKALADEVEFGKSALDVGQFAVFCEDDSRITRQFNIWPHNARGALGRAVTSRASMATE